MSSSWNKKREAPRRTTALESNFLSYSPACPLHSSRVPQLPIALAKRLGTHTDPPSRPANGSDRPDRHLLGVSQTDDVVSVAECLPLLSRCLKCHHHFICGSWRMVSVEQMCIEYILKSPQAALETTGGAPGDK